jgi:hypothetical protein
MDAARTLGISALDYENAMDISNVEQGAIDAGEFRPYTISAKVQQAFQTHADEMGAPNPLDKAYDAIYDIQSQLADTSLDDLFPDITNPLIPMGLGTTLPPLGGVTDALSSLNTPAINPQAVTNPGGNINYNQMTTQQKLDRLFGRG